MTGADALGDATYFTLFARWPDEVRLFTIEWEMIQTPAEALAAVRQNDRTVLVLRNDPDCPRRDVSNDIARLWLKDLLAGGFDIEEGVLPAFITAQLSANEIALLGSAFAAY